MKVMMMLAAIILAGCEQSSTISAPVEFCKASSTGRTALEQIPIQTCAAYDANMNCTVPITTYQDNTRYETRVTCDWVEWR